MLRQTRREADNQDKNEERVRPSALGRLGQKPVRACQQQAKRNKAEEADRACDVCFHVSVTADSWWRASPSWTDPPRQYKFHPKEADRSAPASWQQSPRVYPSTER